MNRRSFFSVMSAATVAASTKVLPSEPPIVEKIDGVMIERIIPNFEGEVWPWNKMKSTRRIVGCEIWWNNAEEKFGLYDRSTRVMHVVKDVDK